jgi:hypothetical protein
MYMGGRQGGVHQCFHAEVLYDYRLSNGNYSSDQIGFGKFDSADVSDAQAIINSYPVGTSVKVYYDPQSPDFSVLKTGTHGSMYTLPVIGLLLFVAGCVFLRLMPVQTSSNGSSI